MKDEVKSVTIIGGTGTLGSALLDTFVTEWPDVDVTIFSRNEHKQAELKRKYPSANFVIGNIREMESIIPYVAKRDLVFHVAAMKHVDIIEANPYEAIKTNVIGTHNVATACEISGVKHMIYSSTDKAVDPINTYGYSKALGEKFLYDLNAKQTNTKFSVYRWGNVLGSQGSAIPFFIQTLFNEKKVYLTHPDMTRFWLPIDWAINYMLRTFPDAKTSEAMVPPNMKTATLVDLCDALSDLLSIDNYETVITGLRPGEKLHEAMYSMHSDNYQTSQTWERYTQDELKELLFPLLPSFAQFKAAA